MHIIDSLLMIAAVLASSTGFSQAPSDLTLPQPLTEEALKPPTPEIIPPPGVPKIVSPAPVPNPPTAIVESPAAPQIQAAEIEILPNQTLEIDSQIDAILAHFNCGDLTPEECRGVIRMRILNQTQQPNLGALAPAPQFGQEIKIVLAGSLAAQFYEIVMAHPVGPKFYRCGFRGPFLVLDEKAERNFLTLATYALRRQDVQFAQLLQPVNPQMYSLGTQVGPEQSEWERLILDHLRMQLDMMLGVSP